MEKTKLKRIDWNHNYRQATLTFSTSHISYLGKDHLCDLTVVPLVGKVGTGDDVDPGQKVCVKMPKLHGLNIQIMKPDFFSFCKK